jgi:hypothetical protein
MIGASAGRGRRVVLAILSVLFVVGFGVSTFVVRSERNAALDDVAKRARSEAQLVKDILTGRQFTKPVTGSSYDDVANKIYKSISEGSIAGVTVWSSRGRIVFSLNESRVGNAPSEMRSLIARTAVGEGSTRVVDDTVQTFTRISKTPDGPVAIVQVDQPLASVDARIDDLWSTLRMGSVFGLAVSLLLLGLTFVSSRRRARAPDDDVRPREEAGGDVKAERRPAAATSTEQRQPTYEEIFGAQHHPDEAPAHAELDGGLAHQESAPEPRELVRDVSLDGDLEPRSQESIPEPREQVPAMAPAGDVEREPKQSKRKRREEVQDVARDADVEHRSPETVPEPESREEALDPALESDPRIQAIQQRREAFKAKAQQAKLRLEQVETELHETSSGRKSEG